ncbi:MAG TPA: hypothetical protein VF735_06700 [Pyrinomonadaceae bacterium]|jgi:hypothetical protein
MPDELIGRDNFIDIFTRTLTRLQWRVGKVMPFDGFSITEIYMLGLASCFQFVEIDNTVEAGRVWIRLTPKGVQWLVDPQPLEELPTTVPQVINPQA